MRWKDPDTVFEIPTLSDMNKYICNDVHQTENLNVSSLRSNNRAEQQQTWAIVKTLFSGFYCQKVEESAIRQPPTPPKPIKTNRPHACLRASCAAF